MPHLIYLSTFCQKSPRNNVATAHEHSYHTCWIHQEVIPTFLPLHYPTNTMVTEPGKPLQHKINQAFPSSQTPSAPIILLNYTLRHPFLSHFLCSVSWPCFTPSKRFSTKNANIFLTDQTNSLTDFCKASQIFLKQCYNQLNFQCFAAAKYILFGVTLFSALMRFVWSFHSFTRKKNPQSPKKPNKPLPQPTLLQEPQHFYDYSRTVDAQAIYNTKDLGSPSQQKQLMDVSLPSRLPLHQV